MACSQALKCHAIFTVKVHAQMLKAPEALPVASKRHSVRVARAVNAYNLFIKIEAKRLRTLDHTLASAGVVQLQALRRCRARQRSTWSRAPCAHTTCVCSGAAFSCPCSPTQVPIRCNRSAEAEVATGPVDLDEGDERAIGVLQRLNTAPVTTAAAVAAPGDGGRGRGRGRGRGQDRARLQ